MKPEIQNIKYKILSLKKLVPGLILFSFVLSGILAPVSFSSKNYNLIETKVVLADHSDEHTVFQEAEERAAKNQEAELVKQGKTKIEAEKQVASEQQAVRDKLKDREVKSPFSCGFGIFDKSNLLGCVGHIVWGLIYIPSTYIIALGGWLFDITLAFTLSTKILNLDFARDGWVVTRDLANMFFIFILLYIAIATILDIAGYNAKALLARLVIVALLLNFSLFAARVVIDASNILALAFYDKISTGSKEWEKGSLSKFLEIKDRDGKAFFNVAPKGISAGLAAAFNPQKLAGSDERGAKIIAEFAKDAPGKLIFIFLFSSAILLTAAWAFFSVAFLFITRTAILWFLMATAPIAFAAIILPKTRKIFEMWWGELVSKSFCVAIFVFFLWLITKFAETSFLKSFSLIGDGGVAGGLGGLKGLSGNAAEQGFVIVMLIILLQFLVLLIMIIVAKQQTQKMCGEVAGFSMNLVSGLGTKAAGFLAGGIGGAALRNTLGAKLYKLSEDKKEEWGAGSLRQRLQLQAARKLAGASFDVRGTKLGKVGELGEVGGKGGYKGAIDRRVREDVAWAKSFGEGKEADVAREKFVQRIEGQNPLSRMITGRGLLSKTEPEKAAKAIKKTLYAAEKAREEDVELREMKNKVLEERPAEMKDEKGNIVYAYKNMNDIEAAVKSNALSILDSEKIVKEATDALVKDLSEKLEEAKADLKGFEVAKNAEGAVRTTKVVETLTKKLGSIEKMTRLEDRVENRNRRMVEKQERESSQKTSSDEGNKDKK